MENKDIEQTEEIEITCMSDTYKKISTKIELSEELQQRIDKAIEYCEEITSREIDISDTDYDLGQDFTARDILDILRGEDNE